ncbi:DUF389 domain-containing protein [Cellulomonas fengjieae]|uniref:DUF389 domain-containing protein n=1 Tax=Cellulomonas fengjieae TaxID=2819978 RepID=UPI001AAFE322|nr:DUF389 domain-containing protein [Cellulomonas fengjieae]MBO3102795.1 DUF389 domain-containing protein [Cellulomonas fengjieae]
MIIAPLSTPIMGLALGLAKCPYRATLHSAGVVLLGVTLVVAVGPVFSIVVPTSFGLLSNEQIACRVEGGANGSSPTCAFAFRRRRVWPWRSSLRLRVSELHG